MQGKSEICENFLKMSETNKRKRIYKKRYNVPILIIVILISIRIALPYLLQDYVNKTLNDIPGYEGHVEDIDIALWRGAYVVKKLVLKKTEAETDTPVLDFRETDISIEWKSLLKGKIVSEIEMYDPKFNYIFEDQKKEGPEGKADTEDWTKALTDLVPIDINHLAIHNGTANFAQLSSSPDIEMFLQNIELDATNLSNVVNKDKTLPSTLHATATSIGDGSVTLEGELNLLKEIPDMDIDFALKKANVTAVNDITLKYAGVDFESGTFELYSEVAIADGYLKGSIKPMFINAKLISKNDDGGIFKKLWEGFVGTFKFLLKNHGTDTLATKVPLEGDLNEVKSGILPTVFNIFKNGWIKAFKGDVDENINFEDAKRSKDGK